MGGCNQTWTAARRLLASALVSQLGSAYPQPWCLTIRRNRGGCAAPPDGTERTTGKRATVTVLRGQTTRSQAAAYGSHVVVGCLAGEGGVAEVEEHVPRRGRRGRYGRRRPVPIYPRAAARRISDVRAQPSAIRARKRR